MIISAGSARAVAATTFVPPGTNTEATAKTRQSHVADPEMQYLSQSDFDLVFQATGRRIDASSEIVPMFAVQLANDRHYGDLPPQGPVPADYLAGLISRYSDSPWMVEQATRALEWVEQRGGRSGVDLNA